MVIHHGECAVDIVFAVAGELTRSAQHSSASRAEQKMLRSSMNNLMSIKSQITAASGQLLPKRCSFACKCRHCLVHEHWQTAWSASQPRDGTGVAVLVYVCVEAGVGMQVCGIS